MCVHACTINLYVEECMEGRDTLHDMCLQQNTFLITGEGEADSYR